MHCTLVVALASGTSSGIDAETPGGTTPYESIEDEEAGEVDETEKSGEDEDKGNSERAVGTVVPQGKDSGAWLRVFIYFYC